MAFLAGQAAMSAKKEGGALNQLIKLIIIVVVLLLAALLIFAIYTTWQNWGRITVWFTTGFIGWLNPFDSDKGDTGPVDIVTNEVSKKVAFGGLGPLGWFAPAVPFFINPLFGGLF